MYTRRMSVMWVRVKSAVNTSTFPKIMSKLREIAARVKQAAPVFVDPIVCADIMQTGFRYPEKRYEHQVGRVMQDTQEDSRDESDISVGPGSNRTSGQVGAVGQSNQEGATREAKASGKSSQGAASATTTSPMWDAAANAGAAVTKNLSSVFKTPAASAKGAEHTVTESAERSSSKSVQAPTFCGVARGFEPGVYETWEEANIGGLAAR